MPFFTAYSSPRALQVLLALLAAGSVSAQSPVPVRSGIAWLDWATEQVAFVLQEAAPAGGDDPAPDPLAATHSIESIEIYRLQQEIHLLRQLIEQEFIARIIALESEMQDMKAALQGRQVPGYTPGPVVPRPDDAVTPQTIAPLPGPEPVATPEMPLPESLPPPETFSFTVVDEWGRSPELAAELGGDASTLIGLAGVVPPRSAREDVVALARELRATYEPYDNINIEIFDSEAAARAYAERQSADSAHHIASISRHRASNRDVILYLAGDKPETVPLAAAE